MRYAAATDNKKLPLSLSIVLGFLAFSVFINYIDRGNLSIAATMLKDELGLSGAQLGVLLSSFFWTYGLFQILSGWLVDRLHVGWVMAVGFFLWSAATSVTGLVHGFTALLVVRIVLGIGESVAYPSCSKILASYMGTACGSVDRRRVQSAGCAQTLDDYGNDGSWRFSRCQPTGRVSSVGGAVDARGHFDWDELFEYLANHAKTGGAGSRGPLDGAR